MALWGLGGVVAVSLLAGAAVCATSGCSTIGYYAQSATGHLNLVEASKPVTQWLADPATSPALKQRLVLSQQIRDFAVADLGEPDNASYRRYHGKAAYGPGAERQQCQASNQSADVGVQNSRPGTLVTGVNSGLW